MTRFLTLLTLLVPLALAACADNRLQVVDSDEHVDIRPETLTYRDITLFAEGLANRLRGEDYFVEAVDDLKAELGTTPNIGLASAVNNTNDDRVPLRDGLYDGLEEAFYTSRMANFVRGADNTHLTLEIQISGLESSDGQGGQIIEYWSRVKVYRLVLPDNPDQSPYTQLIGTVSEPMRMIRGGDSLM